MSDLTKTAEDIAGADLVSSVVFGLGSVTYAINASLVSEIVHPLPVSTLPNCPQPIQGVAVLRGELIAVLNTRSIFDSADSHSSSQGKWIVLTAEENTVKFAIPVGQSIEITPRDSIRGERTTLQTGAAADAVRVDLRSILSKIESAFS